jgi:hypothetical protein
VSGILLASLIGFARNASSLDVPPEVVSVSPGVDATNVSVLANISVIFNKPMNTTSERWNITPFVPLNSSWWDTTTLNLTHTIPMTPATSYVIWVTANNTAGTPLRRYYHVYTWRFTTDCGGTCIVQTSPADGDRNVDLTAGIVIKFSLPADTAAISFSIVPVVPGLTYTWAPGNIMVTLNHAAPLERCTAYMVTVGGIVPGSVPNPWTFTTACPGSTFIDVAASKGFNGIDGSFYAWGDYNRDGNEDLLIDGKRLLRNNGPPNYDFTEVTDVAGIGGTTINNGVWGDYNNDGWLDFYAPGGGWSTNANAKAPWDILWMNNGDGTFTNVTAAAGNVKDIYPSVAAGWGDYDRDGFIDLYVANYENAAMTSGYPDRLWHNDGDGTFTDVTSSARIVDSGPVKPGRGVAWGDYNNDGWLDAYISNYRITANYLWKNRGNGQFVDVAEDLNATGWYQTDNLCYDYTLHATYGRQYAHTIGSAWADFDNDGDIDNFNANLAHKSVGNTSIPGLPYDMRGYITDDSRLFRNDGPPNYDFTDVREAARIKLKPVGGTTADLVDSPLAPCIHNPYKGDELFSNVMWADYDLDGYQDLWIPQVYNISYAYSFLYHNNGDGTFSDVTTAANVRVWVDGYAGAWADYNNDGFPDLITRGIYPDYKSPYARAIRLFENQGNSNSWLQVKLNGCTSNAAAIGARILATANGMTQMRNVEAGSGSHSQMNSLMQEFGFGNYHGTADLLIRWPNNNTQAMNAVTLNQLLRVNEPGCDVPARVPHVSAGIPAGTGADMVLTWDRAMGDDPWAMNVTEYAVYYGPSYDPSASSYSFLGKVPAGTTTFTHLGGGVGDPTTYYYSIQTNGTGGTIRSIAQAVKFAKQLLPGEQLLSIPVPISNYSLESVLRGVNYTHIRVYEGTLQDPWLSYARGRQFNDFDTFAPYQAFWIGVEGGLLPGYFTVAGPIIPATTIHLRAGWNLVGYASTLSRDVASAVAGLGGSFRAMEGYDPFAAPYFLKRMGPADSMLGGEGYWIYMGSDADWTLSFAP